MRYSSLKINTLDNETQHMSLDSPASRDNISVVVPVYYSARTLVELVERLESVLSNDHIPFEIILVNDGSQDSSWQVICELAKNSQYVRGIDLMRNFGQDNALLCGIRAAQFNLIATIDDDLQHQPEELPRLLGKLNEGFDVVYGAPIQPQQSFERRLASYMIRRALQIVMGTDTAHNISSFRLFRARLRSAFGDFNSHFISMDTLLSWGTNRFGVVRVEHRSRQQGRSNYNFGKLVTQAINIVLGFSTLPLRLVSILGFALVIFGFFIMVYVIGRYFIEQYSVPGFPFLASIITIFSGAQMLTLGVFGEYLTRIYFRALNRPSYVIAEETSRQGETGAKG